MVWAEPDPRAISLHWRQNSRASCTLLFIQPLEAGAPSLLLIQAQLNQVRLGLDMLQKGFPTQFTLDCSLLFFHCRPTKKSHIHVNLGFYY